MKVSIVGYGRFGKLMGQILKNDFEVMAYDVNQDIITDVQAVDLETALKSEVIICAVPIEKLEQSLLSFVPFLSEDTEPRLVIDVLSVKAYPAELYRKYLPEHVKVLLTHPMFGPDSYREQGLEGQRIVMDRFSADRDDYKYWNNYFSGRGLKVIEMTPDEHDKAAAESQGITHFVGRVLEQMNMKSTALDTLGAKKLLEIQEQTCNDSWELFYGLQTKNPYTAAMRLNLGRAVDAVYGKLLPPRLYPDRLIVGIQGGPGSFNEEAARDYIGRHNSGEVEFSYLYTTEAVLAALHEGIIDYGQFAMHNSIGGVVQESMRAMAKYKFRIVEEFAIKISHALMIRNDSDIENIETIMTHPQVLKQCRGNLKEKYPDIKQISGTGELIDSANVARHLGEAKLEKNVAVMGSKVLAEIYNLQVVEDNLQDLSENFTTFVWVERY